MFSVLLANREINHTRTCTSKDGVDYLDIMVLGPQLPNKANNFSKPHFLEIDNYNL